MACGRWCSEVISCVGVALSSVLSFGVCACDAAQLVLRASMLGAEVAGAFRWGRPKAHRALLVLSSAIITVFVLSCISFRRL